IRAKLVTGVQTCALPISIQNTTDVDLPIGTDAVLHPDLWFDAERTGATPHTYAGVAYDRVTEQLVLRGHKAVSLDVRVDQGELSKDLMTLPYYSIPMRFSVTTNPMTGTGGVSAGPGGQRVQMPRVVERRGTSMSTDPGRQRVIAKLSQGDGAEKIRALEVLSVTSLIIRATEKATESEKNISRQLEGTVFR